MEVLINKVKTLKGANQRSLISVIRELNESIKDAQDKGYKVVAIHQEITERVVIDLDSFKTLLYRVRKKAVKPAAIENQKVNQVALSKPVKLDTKQPEGFDSKAATQRSKNKLAQFGKGKKP